MPKAEDHFRTGKGMDWGEHHQCLFHGTEKFFRASSIGHLITWIPALDGMQAVLTRGARVADGGWGHGASLLMVAA